MAFAATAPSEDRALLVLWQVQMLQKEQAKTNALSEVSAPGPLVARTKDGAVLIPVPLDYLPWMERVATFARRPDLRAKVRTVWLTGSASPMAKRELTAIGWTVREEPPGALSR